jgi:hypothetical protein
MVSRLIAGRQGSNGASFEPGAVAIESLARGAIA